MNWIFAVNAVLIGAALAVQPAINQAAVRLLGSTAAVAMVSVGITFLLLACLLFATGSRFDVSALPRLPWWVFLGGVVGVAFVFGSIAVAPVIGAAFFFVCVVGGQLIAAALIDQTGLFGMPVRPIDPLRVGGLVLVFAGVALVAYSSQN